MDLILGTAGHIDHGKTTLVRSLTGIDCDRLDEEKRRGITIELGFAWMELPDGRKLGIVDVPGHERFVKNMVAGASGVDCALLVVAADEGVMPQTREHVEICSLLGIRSGVVAMTKIDLVDPEWLAIVEEDITSALKGTFLEKSPIIPVSSVTGVGMEAVRSAIANAIDNLTPEWRGEILRLPVDRAFTMKGFGTVVTGTIISGECATGEKLCVFPEEKPTRARSLEVHNHQVEKAHTGQRCAMNLQGLDLEDVERGDVVARADTLFPSRNWYVRLHCLESAGAPIRQRTEAHFHHGTAECLAKIVFLDRDRLEPGQTTVAEVRFPTPLTAIYGDHFVLRSHSPLRAIGGGVVINPLPPVLRKRAGDYTEKVALLRKLGEIANATRCTRIEPLELIKVILSLYPAPGLSLAQMQVLTALPKNVLEGSLATLAAREGAYCWNPAGGWWIGKNALLSCLEKCEARARELHAREPLKASFAPGALIAPWGNDLPDKFIQGLLEIAVKRCLLEQSSPGLKLAMHTIDINPESARILAILLKKIEEGKWTPPFIKEILEEQGWDGKKLQPLLDHLSETGKLQKIQDGVYYSPKAFSDMVEKIRQWFDAHDELEIGNIKEILGLSRKYAIPLLEYLDASHITYRVGNKRRLAKGQ